VFENDFAPYVEQLRATCHTIQRWVSIDGPDSHADLTFDELLSHGRIERPDLRSFDEGQIAELFYTSGSTGTPQGVMLSHRTLYLHALAVAGTFNHDDNGVELHTIPLFHANGWGRPQTAVMNGIKQVMVRRFDPAHVLQLIQDERATAMSLVPTMANSFLNCPALGKFDTASMQEIHIGGAAAAPELIARMEAAFRCKVMAGYGLTETCPVATSARTKCTVQYAGDEDRVRHLAMAGWPLPGCETRVVDLHMKDVPKDMETVGEVVIRGDNVMDGYFKEPEATAAVMSGDWLRTGDMAVWDRENYIHIVDRKKDIIVSGGENISSIEVEKAICAHPSVMECAVVACPDSKWGEVPAAVVVVKSGQHLEQQELLAFLGSRIAGFKMARVVEFRAQPLPKTGTGKILKRELREAYWAGKPVRVGQS
jgi:fatty-acyl-CoA synthase